MTCEIVSVLCGGPGPVLPGKPRVNIIDNQDNRRTPCQAYQQALDMTNIDVDVLIYLHDDVTIHDPDWLDRIMGAFRIHHADWPEGCPVVAVGLGGATALGNRDLYRTPYRIENMARRGYASNADDAETHGERFTGVRSVAVIEQYCMAIRTDWLRSLGGWPVKHLSHHALDMWVACEAARAKREIWMVGAACHHAGGASSTSQSYAKAKWLQGGTMASDHEIPHRWIYETYRDVLPIETT